MEIINGTLLWSMECIMDRYIKAVSVVELGGRGHNDTYQVCSVV